MSNDSSHNSSSSSTQEDEWETADHNLPPLSSHQSIQVDSSTFHHSPPACNSNTMIQAPSIDDEFWNRPTKPISHSIPKTRGTSSTEKSSSSSSSEQQAASLLQSQGRILLVDLTMLSDNTIHSRMDRHSVNDATGVSTWRRRIECDYDNYTHDTSLLGNGTVIPCGGSVWREALIRIRDDRPGHYILPIFPPKDHS